MNVFYYDQLLQQICFSNVWNEPRKIGVLAILVQNLGNFALKCSKKTL